MMNKGILYKIFIIPLLLIPLVCPFHISADTALNPQQHVIGVNVYPINYESDHWSYGSKTYSISLDSSGDPVAFNLSNLDNYSTTQTIYEVDIIFDGSYHGFVNVSGVSSSVFFNGTTAKVTIYEGGYHSITGGTIYKNDENVTPSMYEFPFESYSYINFFAQKYPSQMGQFMDNALYQFPSFELANDSQVVHLWTEAGKHNYWVFASSTNIYDESTFRDAFVFSKSLTVNKIQRVSFDLYNFNFSGVSVDFTCDSTSELYINTNSARTFIPIYLASEGYPISTEFALTYGLTNSYLTDVHMIAQGTNSSNSSSSALETVSDNISSSSDDLIQSENSFNNSMNSNLQQIDTNINIGNLGNKFLASADWVRTQFNTLTNGTPFGSVLSFSLLLGLALVLVGRIRK